MARDYRFEDWKSAGPYAVFAGAVTLYLFATEQLDVKLPPPLSMLLVAIAIGMGMVALWKILGMIFWARSGLWIARAILVPCLMALALYPVVYPAATDPVMDAPARPDVTLHFVKPQEPAVWLSNDSEAVAENIKWQFDLFNLDDPSSIDGTVYRFVPIPVRSFDFLKPRRRSGAHVVLEHRAAASAVHAGNRLFGSVTVSCPKCLRDRVYWVFLTVGHGGWYSELPADHSVNVKEYVKALPVLMKSENAEHALRGWIPEERRIAIPARID